jgi:hypothetical protein
MPANKRELNVFGSEKLMMKLLSYVGSDASTPQSHYGTCLAGHPKECDAERLIQSEYFQYRGVCQ